MARPRRVDMELVMQAQVGASSGSDTVLKVKRENRNFCGCCNQSSCFNHFRGLAGPVHIKRLARFEHSVNQVYQLVHSRRDDGFRCHALGLQALRHVLDQSIKAHCHHARHVQRFAQLCVTALAHKGSAFDAGA